MSPLGDEIPGAPTPPAAVAPADAGRGRAEDRAGREPGELIVALSPRQIIGGFALLAGLIVWLRRRTRRKG
ncbi:MAG: hypothetical protein C0498_11490 [Anaerolinea sp.]|nr:hypothetical protein [Anaerolinea sp.]